LGCNVVLAHHPIIFNGLKRITGKNYVERTIIKAIKNDISIISCHTNLDNVITGVNKKIADKLELQNIKILAPKAQALKKITTYIPKSHVEQVAEAMHLAGGGQIGNYKDCSFRVEGVGTFTPSEHAQPFIGEKKIKSFENEVRIEMIFPSYLEQKMITTLKLNHPYEEVAYYVYPITNEHQDIGSGVIGDLNQKYKINEFLDYLKLKLDLKVIKHTKVINNLVSKIALCGGSGSFLTQNAIRAGADVYISSDYKYHEFFDADGKMMIIDIGHYESEKFTNELLFDLISNKFTNFALHCTKSNTNPINYY
jgi:dinuclear metal center YbgI/SA1388 family protein